MRSGASKDESRTQPRYVKPEIVDYGDLVSLTAAQGSAGTEDGIGKTVVAGVGGVGGVSVGVGP
jgi:hypothetical protein